MREALNLARKAGELGEVPVGCIIVKDGEIISRGYNRREIDSNALLHAEIIAIDAACRATGDWRLEKCSLYVTLEPCLMCAGAILNSRISQVFFGAHDSAAGACGGVINVFLEGFGPGPAIMGGIMEEECAKVLRDFFKYIRKNSQI